MTKRSPYIYAGRCRVCHSIFDYPLCFKVREDGKWGMALDVDGVCEECDERGKDE